MLVPEDTLLGASRGRPAALGVPRSAEGRRGCLSGQRLPPLPSKEPSGGPQLCPHPSLRTPNRLSLVFLASHRLRQLHEPPGAAPQAGLQHWPLQPGRSRAGTNHTPGLDFGLPQRRDWGLGSVPLWFLGLQGAPALLRGTLPSQDPCKLLGDRLCCLASRQGTTQGFSLLIWKMGMSTTPASGSHWEVDRFREAPAP